MSSGGLRAELDETDANREPTRPLLSSRRSKTEA
jgi:hypothetical protein